MLALLFLNNFDFIVGIFASFTFFAGGWLYFDSWKVNKKTSTPFIRSVGFFVLSVSFLLHASQTEIELITYIANVTKFIGYLTIFVSLALEPILSTPSEEEAAEEKRKKNNFIFPPLGILTQSLGVLATLASGAVGITYLIKTLHGSEKQLKPAAIAFLTFFVSDLLSTFFLFSNTKIVFWSQILSNFGALWLIVTCLELLATSVLFFWIWGYLRFRAQAQLFIISLGQTVLIFLLITVSFTYLTLKNLEQDLLVNLRTNARVFQYAIERLQLETLATTNTLASRRELIEGVNEDDQQKLATTLIRVADTQKLDLARTIGLEGLVIASIDDSESGTDVSSNPLFLTAQAGNPATTTTTRQSAISPEIIVEAAVPIYGEEKEIIGIAETGHMIDSAFVDGIKDITGLEVSIFVGDTRTATTLTLSDGITRYLGNKETNSKITQAVLEEKASFMGKNSILNLPYYTVYEPLKGLNDQVVGMISVAKPQTFLADNLEQSSDITFLASASLIVLSLIPVYFISRFIEDNITA